MKHVKIVNYLFLVIIMLSCKKDNSAINWSEELKDSAWAGEFKYTLGANTDLQPFSIIMNKDKTFTWTNIESTRAGGVWEVDGNRVTLKFLNGTSLSADLSKDKWSNFNNPAINGFEIDNLSHTVIPNAALLNNTTWTGRRDSPTAVSESVTVKFLIDNKAQIIVKGSVDNITYKIEGAGIRDDSQGTYFVLLNSTLNLKGYGIYGVISFYYGLKKQ